MLIYLDHAYADAARQGRLVGTGLYEAIEHGAVNRLRPKLMTVLAIMLGLLPALWGKGTGSEVMQRIAAPMIGGMVSSTVLTLIVFPVLYFAWRRSSAE
jgi:Cu(I)/Ag(I) efflux system membrane protein CusA/SilA